MQLLAFMDGVQNLIETVRDFFLHFQVIYAFEILFFFLLFYYVSKVLRENDATKLMWVYWGVLVLVGCLHIFSKDIFTKQFTLLFIALISAVMIILFSVEVKKKPFGTCIKRKIDLPKKRAGLRKAVRWKKSNAVSTA